MKIVLCILCLHIVVACGESQSFNQSQNIQRVSEYESIEREDEDTQTPTQNVIKKPTAPAPSKPLVPSKPKVPSNPIIRPTDKKVDSTWISDDYKCLFTKRTEIIRISRLGNTVTAIKVKGTPCIAAGQVTWTATMNPGSNTGSVTVRGSFGSQLGTIRMTNNQIFVKTKALELVFDLQR